MAVKIVEASTKRREVIVIVDRALRPLISFGTGAVSGLLQWASHRLSAALSSRPEQPTRPRTTANGRDLGNAHLAGAPQETVTFGLDGQSYEIDLDADHAVEFRSTLRRYIDASRRTSQPPTAPAAAASVRLRRSAITTKPTDTAAIRAWARAHGHPVSDRGPIPTAVLEAYRAAHHKNRRTG